MTGDPLLFALEGSRALGLTVAAGLGAPLAPHEEREFEDGEFKIRPMAGVRERDVYVLHSLSGSPDQSPGDQLLRLLALLGAVRDAGAARVTALVPYLAFARKDVRTKPRDPLTLRYVATFFEAVGTARVVVLDVHNVAAFENAFRCRTEHLEARGLFAGWLRERFGDAPLTIVSPDAGGVKRAERLRLALEHGLGRPVGIAFLEKHRSTGIISGDAIVGQLEATTAVIVDDLISTGTTVARAARACVGAGALRVMALATHGLFTGDAVRILGEAPLHSLVVTDSVPPFRLGPGVLRDRLQTLAIGPLLAKVVERLHTGGSVTALQE